MDLLRHYSDLSSSDDDDEEAKSKSHRRDETSSPRNHRKRARNETHHLDSSPANNADRIKLLPSYQQLDLSTNKHNLFVRNQPHVTGNWCGHIYMSLQQHNNHDSYHILKDLARTTIKRFHNELLSKEQQLQLQKESITIVPFLNMQEEVDFSLDENDDSSSMESVESEDQSQQQPQSEPSLHISLSRHFYLQHQSIQPFIRDLKSHLVSIPPLNLSTCSTTTKILTNDDCTRSFLCLELTRKEQGKAYGQTCNVIRVVDSVLERYGCNTYYTNPSIHVSVASWRYNKALIDTVGSQCMGMSVDDEDLGSFFSISSLQCDFGGKEKHMIPLLGGEMR